jgi:hypothetical protein
MLVPFVTICFAVLGPIASIAAHDNVYNYGNGYLNYTVVPGLFLQDDPFDKCQHLQLYDNEFRSHQSHLSN